MNTLIIKLEDWTDGFAQDRLLDFHPFSLSLIGFWDALVGMTLLTFPIMFLEIYFLFFYKVRSKLLSGRNLLLLILWPAHEI